MSSNRADLETALTELRNENVPDGASRRLMQRINRESTPARRVSSRVLIGLGVAGIFTAIFWPRRGNDIAWAQSLANSTNQSRLHETWRSKDGKITSERWVDGVRLSDYMMDRKGNVQIEIRRDGKREYWYFGIPQNVKSDSDKNPNRVDAGSIKTSRRTSDAFGMRTINDYLKGDAKVLSQETVHTEDGDRTKYRVSLPGYAKMVTEFYAEPETGRIRRIVNPDGEDAQIDYPDTVPDEVFSVESRKTKSAIVYDVDELAKTVHKQMHEGLGMSNGVKLRLAVLDRYGSIWLFWTGYIPDGKMSHPYVIPGVPTSAPFGPKQYTTSYKPFRNIVPPKIDGQRMGAMGVNPKVKIGDTLKEVRLPTPHGTAVFRNIRLLRICSITDFNLY